MSYGENYQLILKATWRVVQDFPLCAQQREQNFS